MPVGTGPPVTKGGGLGPWWCHGLFGPSTRAPSNRFSDVKSSAASVGKGRTGSPFVAVPIGNGNPVGNGPVGNGPGGNGNPVGKTGLPLMPVGKSGGGPSKGPGPR